MKILVVYNNKIKKSELTAFEKGVDSLRRLGHNVKEDSELRNENQDIDTQRNIEKAIKDCDLVLAETTSPDMKIGYNIARALDEKKIVIALEKKDAKVEKSLVMHGNNNKSLVHRTYKNNAIVEVLDDAMNEAKSKLDTKFILIISPEIDRYLEWASSAKRMHKAQLVRMAIEGMMKKDGQYKDYLSG